MTTFCPAPVLLPAAPARLALSERSEPSDPSIRPCYRPGPGLAAALLLGMNMVAHAAPAPAPSPAIDCLFTWAEGEYPAVLTPAGSAAQVDAGYYYRTYSGSGHALAVANGTLWLLLPGSSTPTGVGPLSDWLNRSGCRQADSTPPAVRYTSRSDGAVDTAVNPRIAAAFSEPVEISGPLAEALVVKTDDGQRLAGLVQYDASSATLYFDPAGELASGRRYTAELSSSIRDLSGLPLPAMPAMASPSGASSTTPPPPAYRWQFHTAAPAKRNTGTQNALQVQFDQAVWRYQIPGASMAVLDRQGQLWTTSSGYANLSTRMAMDASQRFRIGSNTKTYVATAVLQLVDTGKVSLDAPVNTYLRHEMQTYLPAYDGNRITVRHLLNHTSGIYNFTVDAEWGNAFLSDPAKRYYPQELLLIANRNATASNAPVFGQFTYSNTNYVLLGLLLRNAGGSTYEDTLQNAIIRPQALNNTLVPRLGDNGLPENTARGYWEDSETGILYDVSVRDPSTVWASGDLIADITDLARWGQALGQGALISPASQTARLQYVDMTANLQYGLGIVRDRAANLLGHQGGMIGYTSQTYYVPDEGATLAFFYNRTLALHDYSVVMTYDALKLLWPERYATLQTAQRPAATHQPDNTPPRARPGLLGEY